MATNFSFIRLFAFFLPICFPLSMLAQGLILLDPALDSMLDSGNRAKGALCIEPFVDLRRSVPQIKPMNQKDKLICGICSVTGGQNFEYALRNVGKSIELEQLLSKVISAEKNPKLLSDILMVADKNGFVDEVGTVFHNKERLCFTAKIVELKKNLSNLHPVVVSWTATPREPKNPENVIDAFMDGAHAMVLVGYNDAKKQFIAMDSRGEDWAEGGFYYLPYRFLNLSWDAFILTLRDKAISPPSPRINLALSSEVELQHLNEDGWSQVPTPAWDSVQQAYRFENGDWQARKDEFRFRFRVAANACYYLLNIQSQHIVLKDSVLYEKPSDWSYPRVASFRLDEPLEHFVILCAATHLVDIASRIGRMEQSVGSVAERLQVGFGDLLAKPENVRRPSLQPSVEAILWTEGVGSLVPIVIGLETGI